MVGVSSSCLDVAFFFERDFVKLLLSRVSCSSFVQGRNVIAADSKKKDAVSTLV